MHNFISNPRKKGTNSWYSLTKISLGGYHITLAMGNRDEPVANTITKWNTTLMQTDRIIRHL